MPCSTGLERWRGACAWPKGAPSLWWGQGRAGWVVPWQKKADFMRSTWQRTTFSLGAQESAYIKKGAGSWVLNGECVVFTIWFHSTVFPSYTSVWAGTEGPDMPISCPVTIPWWCLFLKILYDFFVTYVIFLYAWDSEDYRARKISLISRKVIHIQKKKITSIFFSECETCQLSAFWIKVDFQRCKNWLRGKEYL